MAAPDSHPREKSLRPQVNFIVDFVALVGFTGLLVTGSVMRWVLPPGSGHHLQLWGLDRHQWGEVHFWLAAGLIIALILHVILHWRWIVSMMAKGDGARGRKIMGVLFLAGLLALILAVFLSPTTEIERGTHSEKSKRLDSGETGPHVPQQSQRRRQGPE